MNGIKRIVKVCAADKVILGAAALMAAATLFYGLTWHDAPVLAGDSRGYIEVAESIQSGEFDRPFFRTPGYPILLWLCGLPPSKTIVWVGLLLHGVATVLGVWLMGEVGLGARLRIVFAGLMGLPLYVQSAGILLTENVAQFSLVATTALLWFSLRTRSLTFAMFAGLFAAFAAMVRPAYQLLPVVLSLFGIATLTRLGPTEGGKWWTRCVACGPALGLVPILALCTWNYKHHGYFGLTYALGGNLCNRTALFVERAEMKWEPLRSALIEGRNRGLVRGKSHTALQYQWDQWAMLKAVTSLNDVELAKRLARLNMELILQNPLEYLAAVGRALVSSLFPYVTRLAGQHGIRQILWTGVHFLVIGAWLLQLWMVGGRLAHDFCVWAFVRFKRKDVSLPLVVEQDRRRYVLYASLAGLILYTIVVNALVDVGDPRQRSPVDLFVVMQTILGIEMFVGRMKDPDVDRIIR
ncbi:MAG: hypothetical protein KatS3mg004_0285 [Bryobacteraceae bacterium]|nr:MAG: hypothetical protein KatS3mg004_0285 [Bryobacteraceae bacterium]